MKTLIIRFSSIGDIVFTTVLPRAFKAKESDVQVHFLTMKDYSDLIQFNPNIDKKIYYNKETGIKGLFKLIKILKLEKYDLIYDAHNSLRSNIILLFLRSSQIIQYKKNRIKRFLLTFFKFNTFKSFEYPHVRFLNGLKKIFIEDKVSVPQIFIPQETLETMKIKIQNSFTENNRKLVAIAPGAKWPLKRWDKYLDLVDKLKDTYNVVLLGGKTDWICDEIALDRPNVVSFAGNLRIIESIAVLSLSDLVISNDTGLLHAAEAVGKDVVSIMGPTTKELACPFRKNSKVFETKLWCRPCSKHGAGFCISGARACLTKISVDDIYNYVVEYFAK